MTVLGASAIINSTQQRSKNSTSRNLMDVPPGRDLSSESVVTGGLCGTVGSVDDEDVVGELGTESRCSQPRVGTLGTAIVTAQSWQRR